MISEEAKRITERIYIAYGSGTGVLFGIPPAFRSAVEAIVQCVLGIKEGEVKEKDIGG